MSISPRAAILGIGARIPEKVLSNEDLARLVDTDDEWIVTRTGIRERRILREGEVLADFAAEAAREAIANAGLNVADIDLIIATTYSPERLCPSLSCEVHKRLGADLGLAGAFDLNAACSGFIYGLHIADKLVRAGVHRHVLVLSAEAQSRYVDFTDRATCILFGDGASAAVVGCAPAGSDSGILSTCIGADGAGADHIRFEHDGPVSPDLPQARRDGNPYLRMNGREVFKFAVRIFGHALDEAIEAAGVTASDVDILIPHQANLRIIQAGAERLNLPPERVLVNIDRYGNTASVSIPLGLIDLQRDGRLKRGTTLALVAFGAGYTYGSSIVRW